MNRIKLSICIPTFNRSDYLNQALISIIEQIDDNIGQFVEICVCDNASTDGTENLIKTLQVKYPIRLIYSRNSYNLGADRNFLRVIDMASGEYCWFFGSDDMMAPGGLHKMIELISSGKDIYLCNRVECDNLMSPLKVRHWLTSSETSQVFNLLDMVEFSHYLKHAQSIGALFSFISSIVFKRKRWNSYKIDPNVIGTGYSHVYMLLSFIPDGCDLYYVFEPLVHCRGQNDSFMSKGIVSRIMLDIDGYTMMSNLCEGVKKVRKDFLNVLKRERPSWITLGLIRSKTDNNTWHTLVFRLKQANYNSFIIFVVTYSKQLLLIAKKIRSLFKYKHE